MDYFNIPFLEVQNALSNQRSSPMAYITEEGQVSPAAAAEAGVRDNDNYYGNLEDAVGLDDVERFDA